MNNVEELVSHGINISTAQKMINNYRSKIGTINGDFEIMDINYDIQSQSKDVTLKCSNCGKIIHGTIINSKNKWSELIKTCPDCSKRKRKHEIEILENQKKEQLYSEIGNVYGDYVVESIEFGNPDKIIMKCMECGNKIAVSYYFIKAGKWKNNKCHKHFKPNIKYDESYIGTKIGKLEVIGVHTQDGQKRKFICKCDCGKIKLIRPVEFINGFHKSCGCSTKEFIIQNSTKHGYSGKRLYYVYRNMIERCENPKSEAYSNYGGRGISVCQEWKGENGIENFFTWAYSTGYDENALFGECTIDRKKVDGNYEPSNCRWITNLEQQKNKRPSSEWKKRTVKRRSFVNFNGDSISKIDLCKKYGISVPMFDYRIKIKGMDIEEALTTPKLTRGRPLKTR